MRELTDEQIAALIAQHREHLAMDDTNWLFHQGYAAALDDVLMMLGIDVDTDVPPDTASAPGSYTAAWGAFDWAEGDEPAEASVRRMRGEE